MGGIFTCVDEVPDLQRLEYDMSPFKSNPVPIVWFVGASGSGRHIQSQTLALNTGFENIKISALLNNEALKGTDRGKLIKDALSNPSKKVPDTIVIDLIKETILSKSHRPKGYIINGFPRTTKQASLFVKEIGDVDIFIYLHSDTQVLVTRSLEKRGNLSDAEIIKKEIQNYIKEVKESMSRFGAKIEKIPVDDSLRDVYGRIEAAINERLNLKIQNSNQIQNVQEF